MTKKEYQAALERIDALAALAPPVESPEGKELAELLVKVAEYERK